MHAGTYIVGMRSAGSAYLLRAQQNCYCFAFRITHTRSRAHGAHTLSLLTSLITLHASCTSSPSTHRPSISFLVHKTTSMPESRCTFSRSKAYVSILTPARAFAGGASASACHTMVHEAWPTWRTLRVLLCVSVVRLLVARSVRLGHGAGGGHAGLIICSRSVRSVRSSAGETS